MPPNRVRPKAPRCNAENIQDDLETKYARLLAEMQTLIDEARSVVKEQAELVKVSKRIKRS